MVTRPPSFGRAQPALRPAGAPPLPPKRRSADTAAAAVPFPEDTVDAELRQWNRARPRNSFPWRQLYLMMSLCFGAGALVLPDSINDAARYILYAIAAIMFFSWWRRRGKTSS